MERDALEAGGIEAGGRATAEAVVAKRASPRGAKHESVGLARPGACGAPSGEVGEERSEDRNFAHSRRGFWSDLALDDVPGEMDVDHARGLVDVAPAERAELAEAKSGVVRERPGAAILFRRSGDHARGVARVAGMQALAVVRREHGAARRVVVHAPEHEEAAVDGAQRVHNVRDRRPCVPVPAQALDQALHVAGHDVGNAPATEVRQRMQFQRLFVAADRRRLVGLTAAGRDRAVAHALEILGRGVAQRDAGRSPQARAGLGGEELGAPVLRLSEGRERLAAALTALAETDDRLEARRAGPSRPNPRGDARQAGTSTR